MHYVFDDFMSKEFPNISWVRYADDGALNCVSIKQEKYINRCLVKWVRRKYKKRGSRKRATNWLREIAKRDAKLFAHWKFGILPTAV